MRKHLTLCATLAALAMPSPSVAEVAGMPNNIATPLAVPWPELPDPIPEINYTRVVPEAEARPDVARRTEGLLGMIASWLGANFELPLSEGLPRVELIPPMRLLALRYRGLVSDRQQHSEGDDRQTGPLADGSAVYAVYDDARRTIYLPDGWEGTTPAETSVLVHEMVHHLQNAAGLKYSCPQEREKPAYDAQARWLGLFGKNLSDEFEINPFAILVRTNCLG